MSRGSRPAVAQRTRGLRARRWPRRLSLTAGVILAAAACSGMLALADRQDAARLPRGTKIDGIDVSQRTVADAVALLRSRLGRYPPAVEVRVARRTYRIRPRRTGVWIDYRMAVRTVLERHANPGFMQQVWRELTSRGSRVREQAPVHIDRRRVQAAVARLAKAAGRARRNASLRVTLTRVAVTRSQVGIRLAHPHRLARRVLAALRRRRPPHVLRASVRRIPPRVTTREVRRRHPVVITVARRQRLVRVFRYGRLVAYYRGRAGSRGHPTPRGRFRVATMLRSPLRVEFGRAVFRARGTPGARRSVVLRRSDMLRLHRRARIGAIVLVGG